MRSQFGSKILHSTHPIPMPIGVYAGLEITGASVEDAVTSSQQQTEAILAMHERLGTEVLLTAMDLSVEAELFGCEIRMSEEEIPTVIGRLVRTDSEIEQLTIPEPGSGRSAVNLETASQLVKQMDHQLPVLGGVIGPFSLAGRLFGVSEALELSLTNPEALKSLVGKAADFLSAYVQAFRAQGVDGVIMAEPAAGLLSPRGLGQFSSAFVKQIIEQSQTEDFTIILHNCGARIAHLPKILETGAEILHFGAPMALDEAFAQVNNQVILAGNLDPTAIFHDGTENEVERATLNLLAAAKGRKNFIPSSGCDLPPGTPLRNLERFYRTVRGVGG